MIPLGLTYDDVLLVPQKSRITSRSMVSTRTRLSRHIDLAIPFVSSNVDTVTEAAMAIAMAKLGGIGIIHRFMSIERQVEEITQVKRSEGFVMGKPFTVRPEQTANDITPLLKRHHVSSAIVVDGKSGDDALTVTAGADERCDRCGTDVDHCGGFDSRKDGA